MIELAVSGQFLMAASGQISMTVKRPVATPLTFPE
jgi:hypothetical protein